MIPSQHTKCLRAFIILIIGLIKKNFDLESGIFVTKLHFLADSL